MAEMKFCLELFSSSYFLCSNIFCWQGEETTGCSDDVWLNLSFLW